ncbi:FHA domain-containing protein [Nocardia sp. ET3-3]|uniref:FHA domain-containing protein n=1 Tax=Nocardia terrae TaxID=2675851 RepID=A0A7K1V7C5_9NOCA|nr:FHA domain-containing protein [Nocardia terrae]MVU82526.1 FHA domain-containing protein [Nocardia terrae]
MSGRVEVVPGRHLVASTDGVVVVVAHRDSTALSVDSEAVVVLEQLLAMVADAASRETRRTGRAFARMVSTWLMSREDEERVEFGVLTPGTRGLSVLLHGGVTAVLEGADRREVLRGRDAGFTVDRVVSPAPDRAAAVFVDEDRTREVLPAPGVWSLRDGRMPGSGAVVWLGEQDPTPIRRSIPDLRTPPRRNGRADAGGARTPAPTATPGSGARVLGYKCARGHLNDPRVSFCAVCGIRMEQLTLVLTEGVRPPLGVLLLDDGSSYVLDTDLVIGREPERSEQVRRGAQAIRIPDASGGMSRVHAEIRLVEWDVQVMDRGSANGTHVRLPGRSDWVRATPGHATILEPGSQLLLGGRVFTFDSQHGR